MNLLNKREIKIFLTFFLIYSFFVHWIGYNENSRFALTRAIVDEGRFEIDSFYNQTSDRSFFNGHYYSDKDPGVSFISISTYAVWKFIYFNFFSKDFIEKHNGSKAYIIDSKIGTNNIPIYLYINPGFFVLSSMVLVTIFTSSLFGALLVVLIYKISKYYTKNEKNRLLITFVAGLGTLIFPYSIDFLEHITATFFAFFGFYLLFKIKQEKIKNNSYFILAGLFLGYAITCSAVLALIALGCLVYLFSFNRGKLFYFLIGELVGILPFLFYNYLIFQTPFTLPRYHLDPKIWPEFYIHGLDFPNPFIILRLLIYPYKGLLFYCPILLLSFIGIWYMYKKFKAESILIIFVFLAFLILNSSWWQWWGGASFGPRHLTPVIPFLLIPLIYFLERGKNSNFTKSLFLIFAFYSIFINFTGLQYISDEVIDQNTLLLRTEIANKLNTFSILKNPIYEYYIPRFLKFGPRSPLLENMINGEEPDIRYIFYEKGDKISQFFFYVPFMNIIPVLLILSIVWYKEIFTYLISISKNKFKLSLLVTLIFLCIFLLYLLIFRESRISSEINFERGWFPIDKFGIRWMRQDGIISYYNNYSLPKLMHFNFISSSYYSDRELQLFLNNEIISTETVKSNNPLTYNFFVKFDPGKNILKLHVTPGCSIGAEVGEPDVIDCKSIFVQNLTIKEPESLIFDKNWYGKLVFENFRWMEQNGTIIAVNTKDKPILAKLHFNSIAFNSKKNVEIYVNDRLTDSYVVPIDNSEINTSIFSLKSGINSIKLHSLGECKVIGKVIGNDDKRCVTIGLANISLSYLKYTNESLIFDKNWYEKLVFEEFRWMNQNGTIIAFNIEDHPKDVKLQFNTKSFYSERNIEFYLNNKLIDTFTVFLENSKVYTSTFSLQSGVNFVRFVSQEGCTVIGSVMKNEDKDCISVGLANISLLNLNNINETFIFNYNFYPYHANDGATFMKQNGVITINSSDNTHSTMYLNLTTFEKNLKTQVYLNNELIKTLMMNKTFMDGFSNEFYIPIFLKSGGNTLKFHSLSNCTIIGDVLKNEDNRCVTIGLANISLSYLKYTNNTILFKDNFYPLDKKDGVTFMNQDGLITYIATEPKSIWFNFSVLSFKSPTTIQIYFNDKLVNTSTITKNFTNYAVWLFNRNEIKGSDELNIKLDLKFGYNIIRIHSLQNCTIIGDVLKNEDERCVTIGIVSLKTN